MNEEYATQKIELVCKEAIRLQLRSLTPLRLVHISPMRELYKVLCEPYNIHK